MSDRGVDYFYDQVVRIRLSGCSGREYQPRNLREALPNQSFVIPGGRTFAHSDAALIGPVVVAEPGPAFAHAGDDVRVPVAFDDPRAAERAFDVHVAVEEWFGHGQPADAVTLRMGAMGSRDLNRFRDGLSSLGRVAVTLMRRPNDEAGVFVPTEQGALLGQIGESGRLRFPGLGPVEDAFVRDLRTVEAYRAAASEVPRLVVLDSAD